MVKRANESTPETKYKGSRIALTVTSIGLSMAPIGTKLLKLTVKSLIGSPHPWRETRKQQIWLSKRISKYSTETTNNECGSISRYLLMPTAWYKRGRFTGNVGYELFLLSQPVGIGTRNRLKTCSPKVD